MKLTMLEALLAAGVINSLDDPEVQALDAEAVAQRLAAADVDPTNITDPVPAEAVRLAQRVAVETPASSDATRSASGSGDTSE